MDPYAAPPARRELIPRATPAIEAAPSIVHPLQTATVDGEPAWGADDATLAHLLLRDAMMRTFEESASLLGVQGTMLGSSTVIVKEWI